MRKYTDIGFRVSARREDFLPGEHDKRRKKLGLWYGVDLFYFGSGLWRNTWDNGHGIVEKSSQIQVLQQIAWRQPLLALSLKCNIAHPYGMKMKTLLKVCRS